MSVLIMVVCVLAGWGVSYILSMFGVSRNTCAVCSGISSGLLCALLLSLM